MKINLSLCLMRVTQVVGLIMIGGVSLGLPLLLSACGSSAPKAPQASGTVLQRQVFHLTGQIKVLSPAQKGSFTFFALPIPFLPSTHYEIGNMAKGPDGTIWFEQGDDGIIGHITTTGQLTLFHLPNQSGEASPIWITAGPDNALWFTDATGVIGRITSGGLLTEFILPQSDSSPNELVAGADGALWFTEGVLQGVIVRLTVQGDLTEFPVKASVSSITSGPDGSLWFIEALANANSTNKIGRITIHGKISEFIIPESIEGNELAAGPDGNLWFSTEQGASNQIGRMTPEGQFTFFSLGVTSSVEQIINDGNGSLIFTEEEANKIGIMTTQGTISELFSVPQSNAYPYAITMRVPGEYWFSEIGGNTTSGVGLIGILKTN